MTVLNPKNVGFLVYLLMVSSVWSNKGSLKLTSHGILHYLWSADLSKTLPFINIFSTKFYQFFFQSMVA